MTVHDLSPEALRGMASVDIAGLSAPPESPIGEFPFHDCICGVGCFSGSPPWERHTGGDELLLVFAGESQLTVIEGGRSNRRTITTGQLVIVPRGCWHRNHAPLGVTMLYITPREGNQHSWQEPDPGSAG